MASARDYGIATRGRKAADPETVNETLTNTHMVTVDGAVTFLDFPRSILGDKGSTLKSKLIAWAQENSLSVMYSGWLAAEPDVFRLVVPTPEPEQKPTRNRGRK